jgi:hypothetical protein
MFKKILIAKRGNPPHSGVATKSDRMTHKAWGDFNAEAQHV